MLTNIFSGDFPRSRILTLVLLVIFFGLALAPFVFPSTRSLNTAATICIFILLVASYDLLLGYTGIVSFAHTMFFGIGAYAIAIPLDAYGASWGLIIAGTIGGVLISAMLAFVISMFSLRVQALFFAMVTLAVASAFLILASQLSGLTGGEDGLTFSVPEALSPAYKLVKEKVYGVRINGRIISYYLVFVSTVLLFLIMLRLVNSPFGRVQKAIRENDFRAEALGYQTVIYRTITVCLSASIAAIAGSLMAIWQKYVGPDTTLSLDIMIDILLMVVIGGMGTLYGSVVGATIFILAKNYLQNLMALTSGALTGIPVLPHFFEAERWLLWLGVLFILSVYFFPTGVVGRLRNE